MFYLARRAKNKDSRTKSQEPRAKSQEPRANWTVGNMLHILLCKFRIKQQKADIDSKIPLAGSRTVVIHEHACRSNFKVIHQGCFSQKLRRVEWSGVIGGVIGSSVDGLIRQEVISFTTYM